MRTLVFILLFCVLAAKSEAAVNANRFVATVDTVSDLKTLNPNALHAQEGLIFVRGNQSINDGRGGVYRVDLTSGAQADGYRVVDFTGSNSDSDDRAILMEHSADIIAGEKQVAIGYSRDFRLDATATLLTDSNGDFLTDSNGDILTDSVSLKLISKDDDGAGTDGTVWEIPLETEKFKISFDTFFPNLTADKVLHLDSNGQVVAKDADSSDLSGLGDNQLLLGASDGTIDQDSNLTWDDSGLGLGGYLDLDELSTPASPGSTAGRVFAEDVNGETRINYISSDGRVTDISQDSTIVVRNTSGSGMSKEDVVYITSQTGSVPDVGLAKSDSLSTMPAVAVLDEAISDNGYGTAIILGAEDGLDTSAFSADDTLYVSATTAGEFTNTRPPHPNLNQEIGRVLVSSVGSGEINVSVKQMLGDELGTRENDWLVGDGTSGTKNLSLEGANTWDIRSTTRTSDQVGTLPDASGEFSLLGQTISNSEYDNSTSNFATNRTHITGSNITDTSLTADRVIVSDQNGKHVSSSVSTNQLDILPRAVGGRLPRNGLHLIGDPASYIDIGNPTQINIEAGQSFTITAIVKFTSLGGNQAVVGPNSSGTPGNTSRYGILADGTNIRVDIDDGTNGNLGGFAVGLVTDRIYHFVAVYDRAAGKKVLYVDGDKFGEIDISSVNGAITPSDAFTIGAEDTTGNVDWPLNGSVYQCSLLSNYGANADDVKEFYESGRWPYRISKGTQVNQLSSPSAFDSNDWAKNNVTVSANTTDTTDPDGGNAAEKVTEDSSDNVPNLDQGNVWGTSADKGRYVSLSVSGKPNGRNWLRIGAERTDSALAWFDISTGSVGTESSAVVSTSIEDQGNGWYRCTVISEHQGNKDRTFISMANSDNGDAYQGDGSSGVYLYNAVAKPVGVTAGYRLDEGIGHQVHDSSGNENHGVWNQTSGISWIREKRSGYVEVFSRTANSEILSGIDTLPANAIITDLVVEETAGGDPVDTYVSTAQGDTSTKITVLENLDANGLASLGIIDTLPGGNSTQNLHLNQDGSWAGTLRLYMAYKTHRGR